MTEQEWADWAELVALTQHEVDIARSHHWPLVNDDRAILAANRIVVAARGYVAAMQATDPDAVGDLAHTRAAQSVRNEAHEALVKAVGEVSRDATE